MSLAKVHDKIVGVGALLLVWHQRHFNEGHLDGRVAHRLEHSLNKSVVVSVFTGVVVATMAVCF